MSGFETPGLLWLAVPCLVLWWLFVRVQRRALDWLETHVSSRFRRRFSVHGPRSLELHVGLLLAMALALVVAAAGPFSRGTSETVVATGRLLLLVDGSASMWAEDVERPADDTESVIPEGREYKRMDFARHAARSLMRELEGFRFALGSFSGSGVVHLPMTEDMALVDDALAALEVHSYYRNTGSSLSSALDLVPHFIDRRGFRLQVVILSDGEQPVEDDFAAQLAALVEQEVPVHSVAIGSTQGQSRRILDFQDVVDKKDNPRVLREYHTRRVDRHLKGISRATNGSFFIAEDGVTSRLAAEILKAGLEAEPFEHQAARTDLSGRYLLVFLAGLVFDTLLLGRRPRGGPVGFELERLGAPPRDAARRARPLQTKPKPNLAGLAALAATGLLLSCSLPFGSGERGSPRERAHRENERGITKDAARNHRAARPHYERSMGYEVEPQIPAYNLARSVVLTGDYSEAHDLFQEALLLAPDLPEAHFNDGVTLYLWGQAERDPSHCDLERTRELWGQALRRFSSARAAAGTESDVGNRARVNRSALEDQVAEIDRLIADPPEECFTESSQSSAGGGGAGENESEGGGEESGDGEGAAAPQESDGDPEQQAESPGDPGDQDSEEGGDGGGGVDLTDTELQEIRQQLQALAEQGREPGKFHRRTLPEQFRKSDWSNPDATIWW